MSYLQRYIIVIILALLSVAPNGYAAHQGESQQKSRIKGIVLDSSEGSALEFADIVITDSSEKVIAYGTSDKEGRFEVEVPDSAAFIVLVKMMGYETYVSDILKPEADTELQEFDLGTVELAPMDIGLQEITVVGDKNRIVYKLDRQIISASSSITASGGTLVDVLSNTPSVMVDGEGNVKVRGSGGFLVYIDGKPSPLDGTAALLQIPAASVEDIEILTTPSARYRTDGDAAIINVTTKKSRENGFSGLLNASGSTLGSWGIDGTLNYRKGRHNWYLGGTAQHIKGRSDFSQQKTTSILGIETKSISNGQRWRDNATMTGRAGWQYADGKRHSLSVEVQGGRTDNWRGGDMVYDETRKELDEGSSVSARYNSHDKYELLKDYLQIAADYVWKISEKSELSASSRFRYDKHSLEYTESNLFELSGDRYEGTRGYEQEHHWDCDGALTYRYDYRKTGHLELGYQYVTYSEHGDYSIKYWDREKKEFEWQEDLATDFYYRRQNHSLYAMASDRFGNLSFDAGLRADRVLDLMDIEIKDASRDINRFNLFPSGHLSYDAGKVGTFNLGYSYRTNRPGIWNLEPYITYEDYYTKKIGNPDIKPEYIHSAEGGWRKTFSDGNSLAVNAYFRYRKDMSDWVRTAYEPGVTLDIIVNAGNQTEKGIELNGTLKPFKWWSSTLNGNIFDYRFLSANELCTDANGIYCFANWINAFTLAPKTKLQFDSHFVGPKILTQGEEKAYCYFELAVRQQLFKDKLTLGLVAHDIFRTAKYSNSRITSSLSALTTVRPVYPAIVLSVSYNFNSSTHKAASTADNSLFEGKDF